MRELVAPAFEPRSLSNYQSIDRFAGHTEFHGRVAYISATIVRERVNGMTQMGCDPSARALLATAVLKRPSQPSRLPQMQPVGNGVNDLVDGAPRWTPERALPDDE